MTPRPSRAGATVTARRPGRNRGTPTVTVIGILLLVLGLGCLGYVGYELFGTNITSHHAYRQERDQLRQQWQQSSQQSAQQSSEQSSEQSSQQSAQQSSEQSSEQSSQQPSKDHPKPDPPVPGAAVALMSIPAIGLKDVPVLEGTSEDVLARGIGHYDTTADPGQVGNFAVAGHRITHGEPFAKLLDLRKGDRVIVETRSTVYTYRMDTLPTKLTVTDTEGWVLDPVPGHPTAKPSKRMITLTTCQDLFHSPDRSVGFGHLVESREKR